MKTSHVLSTLAFSAGSTHAASGTHSFGNASLTLCQQLHSAIPSRVAYSSAYNTTDYGHLTAAYIEATNRYNNAANRDDVPACVLFPSSAADVSVAMKLLSKSPTVPFALKSGGHDWNRGFSSTDGGVLISFRPYLNYTTLSKDKKSAEVGPGSRWAEVLAIVDKQDRAVVGGRNGDVGVGGLVPRGGISLLTGQYGFASDNVISFEVVLANGTIVNASKQSHPDLFWALRGGGNLFGAITKFTLQAHPISNVWGGERTYDFSQTPALLRAIAAFTSNYSDPKAAIVPTLVTFGPKFGGGSQWTMPMLYNSPSPPPAHVFAVFDPIPTVNSTTGPGRRYPEIIDNSGEQPQFRAAGAFNSLPNLPAQLMGPFLNDVVVKRAQGTSYATTKANDVGFEFLNLAIQPMPVLMQQANVQRGPAALQMKPEEGDKIWVEYTVGWDDSRCDFTCMRELRGVVDTVETSMRDGYAGVGATNGRNGTVANGFAPLFGNDAMWDQGVYRSYGEDSFGRIGEVRKAYDPAGVFLAQTSHFTL